jgi:hypothetical protein
MNALFELGQKTAFQIWADAAEAQAIVDPRNPDFARGVIAGLAASLAAAPGVIKRVVDRAAAAAEDLNVEAFQGLVEVLQNADDLNARSVRFALSDTGEHQSLLVVHDGAPVTCHHMLPMTLPYLTTKSGDAEQRGRFGIGLKTLRRISSQISIHSAPYHFSAQGLDLIEVDPVQSIAGFYDPDVDTLLELKLIAEFSPKALEEWFEAWDEDGLLFQKSVRRFVWVDLKDGADKVRAVEPGPWQVVDTPDGWPRLARRKVLGSSGSWLVFRSDIETPADLDRSHKATGATTAVSVAFADHLHPTGLFIGFRTRVPVTLPFSIDAQFDPSTAREGLIDNGWNRWLIGRCGAVLTSLGLSVLRTEPTSAWGVIPLSGEGVGLVGQGWPQPDFAVALASARSVVAEQGEVMIGDTRHALADVAYETSELEGLLGPDELTLLRPDKFPLGASQRDVRARWRKVLDELKSSTRIGAAEVGDGFSRRIFGDQPVDWWIDAGARLTSGLPDESVFGLPCWLTDKSEPTACSIRGATARPLLVGEPLSEFARYWELFDRLHDRYADLASGAVALNWLNAHAAIKSTADAVDELEAFAERFVDQPIDVTDVELAMIRDRFDLLTDRRAEPLGPKVGKALLLDAFVYRAGKRADLKVSPTTAYISRTLDSDHPYWPDAAGMLPGVVWLASSYDLRLKTGATRSVRKRADGTISRAARKFLMLLGAVCWPRVVQAGPKTWGGAHRTAELKNLGAELVENDFTSPDLERVLASLGRASKKDRRARSAALVKALTRYWDVYSDHLRVQASHQATKYRHPKGMVDADWLCRLRDTAWVAVGSGDLRRPSEAVVRSDQTRTLYSADDFIVGIAPGDIAAALAATLKIIVDVRASDLVASLEQARAAPSGFDPVRVQQAYRSLAKLCPNPIGWNKVGDLALADLKARFSADPGLIWVPAPGGDGGSWRRPDELFIGKDIFLEPARFVPGSQSCHDLWSALGVRRPTLDACIAVLRSLADAPYSTASEAVLIEVYRYIEPMLAKAERRQRERLRGLPVGTYAGWSTTRPVLYVADRELAGRLAEAMPGRAFWTPPCDTHALPHIRNALGLTVCWPILRLPGEAQAAELGEVYRARFQRTVDQLSNELARNDPAARERIRVPWKSLRDAGLFVYPGAFDVTVSATELVPQATTVRMRAVLQVDPLQLHVDEHALPQRENCGRAIASLFPAEVQRRIEAEWIAAWMASDSAYVRMMPTASDEEHERAMADRAALTAGLPAMKIKVSAPLGVRGKQTLPPRRLKTSHGSVAGVTIVPGVPPKTGPGAQPTIATTPPPPPPPPSSEPAAPVEYSTRELEQRGWEILEGILRTTDEAELVDFRRRHHVGADGVVAWKTFVELKATGRAPQGSVELSATEYERAKESGLHFIVALVSGLEEGFPTEVRLILDPANRATVRPVGAVRLVGLAEAPAVVIRIGDDVGDETNGNAVVAVQDPLVALAD